MTLGASSDHVVIDRTDATWADDTITVVIPEFVVHRWWEHALHNQSALLLKARLLYRPNTVGTSVPWRIDCRTSPGPPVIGFRARPRQPRAGRI